MDESHAILGAGGVGGLIGTLLAAGGDRVTVILREAALSGYPAELTLRRPDSTELHGPVRAVTQLERSAHVDVLWVTTKALQLQEALRSVDGVRPRCVVPLLNGLDHIATLERTFGASAVIPGTIAVEAERISPGVFRQGSPFVTLRHAERGRSMLAKTAETLGRFGADVAFDADEKTLMWSKLVLLAPFALTTAASGEPIGFIRDHAEWRALAEATIDEVAAAGNAEGAKLDAAATRARLDGAPAKMSSSMARDVAAGHEPELDAIGGAVLRAAERHGIGVPALQELMQRVRDRVARIALACR
jgi:2-dehydropantoate 2-reductase